MTTLEKPAGAERRLAPKIGWIGPTFAVGLGLLAACGGSGSAPPPPPPGAPPPVARVAPPASASVSAPQVPINDSDFTESDSSRDPFHVFVQAVKPVVEVKVQPQYTVLLEKYSLDELKLVAIVSAGDGPRAMFIDPTGKGHIVLRGMHMARGELVKLGAGAMSSYPLHWKVDRIKPNEVVLVREDTLHPEVQPTYREIFLHTDTEKT